MPTYLFHNGCFHLRKHTFIKFYQMPLESHEDLETQDLIFSLNLLLLENMKERLVKRLKQYLKSGPFFI